MKIFLLVISILLIIIVLLQSGKAEGGAQIISGGQSELFSNRKERGSELVITRITMFLAFIFFSICLVTMFM
jgi:preprotein translocase subunit SecG